MAKYFKYSLVIVFVGLVAFAFILAPNWIRGRKRLAASPGATQCEQILHALLNAKTQWMIENHKTLSSAPTWDELRELYRMNYNTSSAVSVDMSVYPPIEPDGGTYTIGSIGELPRCSIERHGHYLRQDIAPKYSQLLQKLSGENERQK